MWYEGRGEAVRAVRAVTGGSLGMNQPHGGAALDAAGDAVTFYARLAELLAAGERLALCTILRLAGSGPRRAGAKMLVREAGGSAGSIGGGVL